MLCEVTNGTDPKLRLYQNENKVREGHKLVVYHWNNLNAIFKCLAKNVISEETSTVAIQCSGAFTSRTQPARPMAEAAPGPRGLGWQAASTPHAD